MSYKYTHFIPENTAPAGAEKIGVYDADGKKVCTIPLGGLTPPGGEKLYSFCVLADIHLTTYDTIPTNAFRNVLEYVNGTDCEFICIAGDLVDNGSIDAQMELFKTTVDTYAQKPVYAIAGNHETIWGDMNDERMQTYAGQNLYYTIVHENDLFVFLGHYGKDHSAGNGDWRANEQFSAEELAWFEETIAVNKDKRCFVITHLFPWDGSGNVWSEEAQDYYHPNRSNFWSGTMETRFENILTTHPNVILFHGHSHFRADLQALDEKANYTTIRGYKSVHVPSATRLRDVVDNARVELKDGSGQGYIVDVHEDCIVLHGWDFVGDKPIPLGTFKITT